jgi:hypothetical protein
VGSYRLVGGENLQQYANQQVEIQGTFQDPTGAGASATGAAGATDARSTARTLQITSIKVLSPTCPGGGGR